MDVLVNLEPAPSTDPGEHGLHGPPTAPEATLMVSRCLALGNLVQLLLCFRSFSSSH